MNVSVIPEDYTSYTFENVKIGDMFLNDEGTWFMKVKYGEASCGDQEIFGLCFEDGVLYTFEDEDPITRFFTPKNVEIQ